MPAFVKGLYIKLLKVFSENMRVFVITLEFLISVAPQINVAPGKFGRNNKHTPLK